MILLNSRFLVLAFVLFIRVTSTLSEKVDPLECGGLDLALVARGWTRARHEKHSPQLGGFCSEAGGKLPTHPSPHNSRF